MSEVHDRSALSMLLADYAMTDPLGRLHVVGGGIQVLGRDHTNRVTQAFALVTTMFFEPALFQEQFVFEVFIEHVGGAPVLLPPGQAGQPGGAVRFAQNMTVDEPNLSRAGVPRRALPAQQQLVIYFNTGLPLPPSEVLVWRACIDGESRDDWTLPFFVAGPPPAPVIG
jgi:hypothetical protein